MGKMWVEEESSRRAVRDPRGILAAALTALVMWIFLIIGVLGFVFKIMR